MEKVHINTDFIVKDILKKSSVHTPSGDFTDNIMTLVSTMKPIWAIEYKPIISRKAWFLLGTFVTLSIALIIITASMTSSDGARQYTYVRDFEIFTNTIGLYLKSFFSGIKIPILFPLGLGFVLFALFIEPLFRKVFKTKNPV